MECNWNTQTDSSNTVTDKKICYSHFRRCTLNEVNNLASDRHEKTTNKNAAKEIAFYNEIKNNNIWPLHLKSRRKEKRKCAIYLQYVHWFGAQHTAVSSACGENENGNRKCLVFVYSNRNALACILRKIHESLHSTLSG